MDNVKQKIRLREFKVTGKLPDFLSELPKNSKDLVKDIENFYEELAERINWLLYRPEWDRIYISQTGAFGVELTRANHDSYAIMLAGAAGCYIYNRTEERTDFIFRDDGGIEYPNVKSGATQVAAGAAANEIWKTNGHATLPDNVLMIGV